jgi:hypothetical protein
MDSPRRRLLAAGIVKPTILSAQSPHRQEKPDIFRVLFHWMRAGVKLAAPEHPGTYAEAARRRPLPNLPAGE